MELTLEETMKRKDYKLKYKWHYCHTCEAKGLDPHRTTYVYIRDFDDSGHNINQYHGQLGTKDCHIEKPMKYCTKCNKTYAHDVYICTDCQSLVDARTTHELIIEESIKGISRTQRLRSRGKLTADEAKTAITVFEQERLKAQERLDHLS